MQLKWVITTGVQKNYSITFLNRLVTDGSKGAPRACETWLGPPFLQKLSLGRLIPLQEGPIMSRRGR